MDWFMTVWPWMGLGAAIVLLILLLATNWLRSDTSVSRWHDLTWIAWLATVAYMLHNVEEYGIDFIGATLSFPDLMSGIMGSTPESGFFLAVNLSLVWVMGPVAAILSRKYPAMAFGMIGIQAINLLTHIPGAIAMGTIKAGFVTAVVIFLPMVTWAFVGLTGSKATMRRSILWAYIGFGALYHVALFGTVPMYVNGIWNGNGMGIWMLFAGAGVFTLWLWYAKRIHRSTAAESPARLRPQQATTHLTPPTPLGTNPHT